MFRLNPSAKQLQKKITGGQLEEDKVTEQPQPLSVKINLKKVIERKQLLRKEGEKSYLWPQSGKEKMRTKLPGTRGLGQ